jgi:hypothetical protein
LSGVIEEAALKGCATGVSSPMIVTAAAQAFRPAYDSMTRLM